MFTARRSSARVSMTLLSNSNQRMVRLNRILFLENFEQDNLSVAVEILFEVGARLGRFDLDFPSRQA